MLASGQFHVLHVVFNPLGLHRIDGCTMSASNNGQWCRITHAYEMRRYLGKLEDSTKLGKT